MSAWCTAVRNRVCIVVLSRAPTCLLSPTQASSEKHQAAAEESAAALAQQMSEADRLRSEVAALSQRAADLEKAVQDAGMC